MALRTRLDETREILAKKEVAIDKLGKSRRIVEILLAAGGAAAEVRKVLFPIQLMIKSCMSLAQPNSEGMCICPGEAI